MKKVTVLLLIFITVCFGTLAENTSRKEYIRKYKDLAIQEMKRVGIPASITLAQGLLESGSGSTILAKNGNNHFGIKCHDWTGKSINVDDDLKNECFRKYKSVYESYIDHSNFLTSRSRYASLFKIPKDNYRKWAHGLKKAGYATDPRYAHKLIRIIEEENLYVLDRKAKKTTVEKRLYKKVSFPDNIDPFGSRLEIVNGTYFIIVIEGDSFYKIEKNLSVSRKKLLKNNELPRDYALQIGQILFLHPKKRKAARGYDFHLVKKGDNMYEIAQRYGVKLKYLYRYNDMKNGEEPRVGDRIWLRER